mmetsp:Transcript_31391/g.47680  ORF Transcript_31391/g.47680 Transcript_31391/m.47680 type:complete len:86 (+) Transcript_31391:624-881(+)
MTMTMQKISPKVRHRHLARVPKNQSKSEGHNNLNVQDDLYCDQRQLTDGKSLQRRKDLDHSLFRHDSMAGGGASMSIMPFCHLEE